MQNQIINSTKSCIIILQYRTNHLWNHVGSTNPQMTSSWQNGIFDRSHKGLLRVVVISTLLAKFDSNSLQRRVILRAMPPSSMAIIRSLRERVYIDFARTPFKYTIIPPSSTLEISILFSTLSQPTTLAMTIARQLYTLLMLEYMPEGFMRKAMCLRPL